MLTITDVNLLNLNSMTKMVNSMNYKQKYRHIKLTSSVRVVKPLGMWKDIAPTSGQIV